MCAQTTSPAVPADFGPDDFTRAQNVSRETLARLKTYVGLLQDWNARHNLVSDRSLEDVWRRHVWDSAQLMAFIPPKAQTLVDLGSGAGFPALVLAELLRDRVRVVLYESVAKKCAFLATVADRLGLNAEIRNSRIEEASREPFDVVTARACAPLPKLLAYAQHFTAKSTVCLLLKGQNIEAELTDTHKSWRMKVQRHQSLTDSSGVILEIRELAPNDRR